MTEAEHDTGCSSKGFKALMATQFFGAMNDNLFKVVLTLVIANALIGHQANVAQLVWINVVFIAPFLFFSPFAGSLADSRSKSSITCGIKIFELLVMGLAFYFFYYQNVYALLFVLFLMGFQSTVFSPAKYGILPEILSPEYLSKGNGYIQFWTFVAIICGTALGGVLLSFSENSYILPASMMLILAVLGLGSSFFVTKTKAANPNGKIKLSPISVICSLKEIRKLRNLFLTVLAISFFWAVSAMYQLNIVLYAKQLAHLNDMRTSLWLAALGVGIGTGSVLAGVVSQGKVEMGLVPIGAAGLALCSLLLCFSYESYYGSMLLLLGLGIAGGFFIVPLNAYLQQQSPPQKRGDYIAAANLVSFAGMLLFSFLLLLFVDVLSFSPAQVFFAIGILSVGVTVYICSVVPEFLLRCINWITLHSLYRMKVVGLSNIPESGGALLVCNHVTFIDAPLLLAAVDRPIRFLIHKPIYESKLVNPVAKAMKTIPIESGKNREEVLAALELAREAINKGELVGIFPEGGITRIARMLKFKKGLEKIMEGVDAPIIPVHLDQMWGSIFSRRGGKFFWKVPRYIPYPTTVSFGKALPPTARAYDVRRSVQELSAEAFVHRKNAFQILHRGFIKSAKRNPLRKCMADSLGSDISYFRALAGSLLFSRFFNKKLADEKMVGVYLPPTVPAALVNIGLLLAGKIPVNLNYTASKTALGSAITRCGIRSVISSNSFVEKMPFSPEFPTEEQKSRVKVCHLDELKNEFSFWQKTTSFLAAALLPESLINLFFVSGNPDNDDLATVIFSSGSTGEPKGVMLSHGNISSNITSTFEIFEMQETDCVMGILPFFHSFGFMATLWLPLLAGARVVYHTNPMQANTIGKLVHQHKATVLMATPTFLMSYIKKVKAEQFTTLRNVFVGAEKLKKSVQDAFTEKFGVCPREGYGCTELSPIALGNIDSFKTQGITQIGEKTGTAGHPIPGVAVKIVDPENGENLSFGQNGLLLVKGPNVMLGYLGDEQKTSEVIQNEWYITGDIAQLDEDGFVTITDRLSRFSKIAGEMVPHIRIEEEIHDAIEEVETVCAVTGVPDEQKGEKLIVISTRALDGADLAKKLAGRGLPNLWIPRKEDYYQVESIPILGSGKLDLKGIKQLALEQTQ